MSRRQSRDKSRTRSELSIAPQPPTIHRISSRRTRRAQSWRTFGLLTLRRFVPDRSETVKERAQSSSYFLPHTRSYRSAQRPSDVILSNSEGSAFPDAVAQSRFFGFASE